MKSKRTFQYLAVAMIALAWTMTIESSRALAVDTAQFVSSHFMNLHVARDSTVDQTETAIAVDPNDPLRLVIGSNTRPSPNFPYSYVSIDGGVTFDIDTAFLITGVGAKGLDPALSINSDTVAFYAFRDESELCETCSNETHIGVSARLPNDDVWGPLVKSQLELQMTSPG